MNLLKTNDYLKNIIKMFVEAGIATEEEIMDKVNAWHPDTLYFLENGRLTDEKQLQFDVCTNKERWLYKRSLNTYLISLVKGWLAEELCEILIVKYFNFKKEAQDKFREILFANNMFDIINSKMDATVSFTHHPDVTIDIMGDFTSYCKDHSSISLNFKKYDKLKHQGGLLFVVDVKNEKIGIINPKNRNFKCKEIEGIKDGEKKEMELNWYMDFVKLDKLSNSISFFTALSNALL